MIDVEALRSVTPHGKFFSRKDQKFFLKAMRLEGVGATLDFDAKVRLLARLDDLKQVHTTALVLTEPQSNPIQPSPIKSVPVQPSPTQSHQFQRRPDHPT